MRRRVFASAQSWVNHVKRYVLHQFDDAHSPNNLLRKMVPVPAPSAPKLSGSGSRPFTVVVEGNIGSGKTTFLKHFGKLQEVQIFTEPVESWRNLQGHNLLELLYQDPARWSFTFQSYVQLTMLDLHTRPCHAPVKLMERSMHSSRYCFVENMYQSGVMAGPEHAVLSEWFDWMTKQIDVNVDLIVYLRSDPEVVYERIMKRNRKEEKTIPLEYLKQLHQVHEDWLHHKVTFPVPAQVLEIDANVNLDAMLEQILETESQILNRRACQQDVTGEPVAVDYLTGTPRA